MDLHLFGLVVGLVIWAEGAGALAAALWRLLLAASSSNLPNYPFGLTILSQLSIVC
jgi:hypothetical protein